MTKNEKKYLLEKLKKAALVASSVVTGLTVGGCEVSNKKDEAVANNNIVFIDEQTDATTSTIESTETTTTFKPINTDIHRRKYVDGNDSSSDTEYVETSYENDLITSSATVTSTKNSNDNVVIDDNTTTYKTTTRPTSKTSSNNNKTTTNTTKTTKTTTKTTKTTPDTTKTTTSKTTTKPTTSKTTTTVTTTTEAVTEPPVTEPVQRDHVRSIMGYNIEQIAYDSQALSFYSSVINSNMLSTLGYDTMYTFDIGYGQTSFSRELSIFMIAVNPEIQDDCINANINYFDPDDFENYKTFLYNFKHVQEIMGADIDFANYIIDVGTGEFLNNAFSADKNGTYDQFMSNAIASGNISPNVLNNAGAMAVLYSCDGGRYLNYSDIDNNLNENFNRIRNAAFGPDYIK